MGKYTKNQRRFIRWWIREYRDGTRCAGSTVCVYIDYVRQTFKGARERQYTRKSTIAGTLDARNGIVHILFV